MAAAAFWVLQLSGSPLPDPSFDSLTVAALLVTVGILGWLYGDRLLDAQRTLRVVKADYNQTRFERISAWLDIERLRARNPFQAEEK